MTTTPAALKSSRPKIAVDGNDSDSLAAGLFSMRVEETADGLFHCRASFGNWGSKDNAVTFLYFDRRTLEFGKQLAVKVGDDKVFDGRITALEAEFPEGESPRIAVLAEDRFQDLRMTRRTRTFADVSDADVFRQVASDHGLTPDVTIDGPTYRVLAQVNQSDLAFLRDRARTVDAELWMNGSTLCAKKRPDRGGATVTLGYGRELREFTVAADLAGQRSEVRVGGWDVSAKEAISETASESLVSEELAGGTSGTSILGSALGARPESVVSAVLSTREARSRAETLYRRIARRFVSGWGVAETAPGLRVGAKVRLEHLGDLFSGDYYVTEVVHRFDDVLGLRSEFAAERPGLGASSS